MNVKGHGKYQEAVGRKMSGIECIPPAAIKRTKSMVAKIAYEADMEIAELKEKHARLKTLFDAVMGAMCPACRDLITCHANKAVEKEKTNDRK